MKARGIKGIESIKETESTNGMNGFCGKDIYRAISEIDPELVESTAPTESEEKKLTEFKENKKKNKGHKKLISWLGAAAACLCIMLCGIFVLIRLGYLTAGCGSYPGTVVNDRYYFCVPHRGIYEFTPEGGSKMVVSDLLRDDRGYSANDYGVYYTRNGKLYVRVNATGKTKKIFDARKSGGKRLYVADAYDDGTVKIRVFGKNGMTGTLLIDGKSGETVKVIREFSDYRDYTEKREYKIGNMTITSVYTVSNNRYKLELFKDGEKFLDDADVEVTAVMDGRFYSDDVLLISCMRYEDGKKAWTNFMVAILPDGTVKEIYDLNYTFTAASNGYIFYVPETYMGKGKLCAYNISTGESICLIENYSHYEVIPAGEYIYTTAPWSDTTSRYKLLYDADGKLCGVELTHESIISKKDAN